MNHSPMPSASRSFYVTTPIYYVNDAPHIGHSYTTVLADALSRFHRLFGDETFFLTGTDEHGLKVQQAAQKLGHDPKTHCDLFSERFRATWARLGISLDHFIRTTDPEHVAVIRKVYSDLMEKGRIYSKEYEGWYSVGEERFFSDKELVDGKDPISGRPVEWIKEKNYWFRMSEYQERLIRHIEENPDFIQPDFRRNEVLGFLRQPLGDLCVSRPKWRLSWGIELPFDPDFVAYVWVDALFNYYSATVNRRFPSGAALWPCDYHIIGKDILTTHAVYWPTLLMALDLPLPRHILAHGWWLSDNARMSKTTGNVVNPMDMMDKYGVDAFRYFLCREMVVGQDASFSEDLFVQRVNSDLANDLGNGLSRVLKLAASLPGGRIAPAPAEGEEERTLVRAAAAAIAGIRQKVGELKLSQAVDEALSLVRAVNRYLEVQAPWKLAKTGESGLAALNTVLYHAAESLRIAFTLLHPIMPLKMEEALAALGFRPEDSALEFGRLDASRPLAEKAMLFPRIAPLASAEEAGGKKAGPAAPDPEPFSAVDLRVGRIREVSPHPNADSLYVLRVDLGSEQRTVAAGLRKHCMPEELLGRLIVLVRNLKPAQIRGVESQGMILASETAEGKVMPVFPEGGKPGERVSVQGIGEALKGEITLKEFGKCKLQVQKSIVVYKNQPLRIGEEESRPVRAEGPDGSEVR